MKLRTICKSKIHAVMTASDVDCIRSIGIDKTLMELTDIVSGKQVAVWNVSSGARIETYAAARHFTAGRPPHHRRLRPHRRAGELENELRGRSTVSSPLPSAESRASLIANP